SLASRAPVPPYRAAAAELVGKQRQGPRVRRYGARGRLVGRRPAAHASCQRGRRRAGCATHPSRPTYLRDRYTCRAEPAARAVVSALVPARAMNDTATGGSTALDRLAARSGILPAYYDVSGGRHVAAQETKRALLAVMGIDASTDAAAAAALAAREANARAGLLPP